MSNTKQKHILNSNLILEKRYLNKINEGEPVAQTNTTTPNLINTIKFNPDTNTNLLFTNLLNNSDIKTALGNEKVSQLSQKINNPEFLKHLSHELNHKGIHAHIGFKPGTGEHAESHGHLKLNIPVGKGFTVDLGMEGHGNNPMDLIKSSQPVSLNVKKTFNF